MNPATGRCPWRTHVAALTAALLLAACAPAQVARDTVPVGAAVPEGGKAFYEGLEPGDYYIFSDAGDTRRWKEVYEGVVDGEHIWVLRNLEENGEWETFRLQRDALGRIVREENAKGEVYTWNPHSCFGAVAGSCTFTLTRPDGSTGVYTKINELKGDVWHMTEVHTDSNGRHSRLSFVTLDEYDVVLTNAVKGEPSRRNLIEGPIRPGT